MKLRKYQNDIIEEVRPEITKNRAVVLQMPTGSGKTAVMGGIISLAQKKKLSAWFIVPRTELLKQGSDHLLKWGINHGIIAPGRHESKLFDVHVVSKDTLLRRWDKIKYPPGLIIWDECHVALDNQLQAKEIFKDTKFIGLTATPERTDGRGLNDMYDSIVYGPSIPYLTETGYLVPVRYFSPPIEGLQSLHKQGFDYKEDELEQLLLRRHVYGQAIEHYKKYAHKKPGLIFCRSVKAAYETARQFRDAGYNCECIEGAMSKATREALLDGLRNGKIDLLTNCDLCTYGVDVPVAEVGIMLRPTTSRALYFQMVGRILRPSQGKKEAIIFDHVNNLVEHADDRYPDIPPFYINDLKWNFECREKKRSLCKSCQFSEIKSEYCKDRKTPVTNCKHYKKIEVIQAKLCEECFLYYQGAVCPNCGHKKETFQKKIEIIPEELKEIKPVALKDRPIEERKEYQDNINELQENYSSDDIELQSAAVKRMLEIQKSLGYDVLWAYRKLNDPSRKTINITLLHQISRERKYKKGWAWYQKKRMEGMR